LTSRYRCPAGRQLVTLEDAGNYITKLPEAEHEAPEWQAAMQALMLVATSGGPTMFARIGVMRALTISKPDRASVCAPQARSKSYKDRKKKTRSYSALRGLPRLSSSSINWSAALYMSSSG